MRYINTVEELNTAKKGDIIVKNSEAWIALYAPKKHITGSDAGETYGDDHFVPDMTGRQQEQTVSQKLHAEAGTESQRNSAIDDLFEELAEERVDNGIERAPEDGEHIVRITGMDGFKGRNGRDDFFVFQLRDTKTNQRWDWLVSKKNVSTEIDSISANNGDCFEQMNKKLALNKLLNGQTFRIFTVKKIEDGKILNYTDEEKYGKYIYWQSTQIHREEERIQRTLERKAVEKYIEKTCEKMPWDE